MNKEELKIRFREWLTEKGVEYLRNIFKEHGTLLAVWNEGGIPHCVHFREGMHIRNWMRGQPEFENKDCEWLDDNWASFTQVMIQDDFIGENEFTIG